jgi:hypothetical protein
MDSLIAKSNILPNCRDDRASQSNDRTVRTRHMLIFLASEFVAAIDAGIARSPIG